MDKLVYLFEEGSAKLKDLLGNKGAQLAEMTAIGLPVPPGFIITSEVCNEYSRTGKMPGMLHPEIKVAIKHVEKRMGKAFGSKENPLLFSVRSGAAVSMPGMMDTVLNLGLNDETVEGLAKKTGDARFAYDCYRRFIQMFSDVVLGADIALFEKALCAAREKAGAEYDSELSAGALKALLAEYKGIVKSATKHEFPQKPWEQLDAAIAAVFKSWNNKRAVTYRKLNRLPDSLGTAVTIQSMVFGNFGKNSGTGVAFTRNPSTGERLLYGEYLMNAQGEDVVAGIRTPHQITKLQEDMPAIYKQFVEVCNVLERHYRDVQDVEFTVENGKLYILQTRNGKRTAAAAVKIAVDMAKEGLIAPEEAVLRVEPEHLDRLLHPGIDPSAKAEQVAKGLPASPGAAVGGVVFDADDAERLGKEGKKVILVRPETTPDDIHGIVTAQGVLTSRGGMTCHAAIVTRGMGKPCIVGCDALRVDVERKNAEIRGKVLREGDVITIDGSTGAVMLGAIPLVEPSLSGHAQEILAWADDFRRLGVRANADTPQNAAKARKFGAQGIGLCRTERMFNAQDRLPIVQEMILSESPEERRKALEKLLPMQRGDFKGILEAMDGLPVTIRLLDPPLHEFLPNIEEVLVEVAELRCKGGGRALAEKERLLAKIRALQEFNPMLGHRGCRLGLTFPDVYEMQVRAIFEAAIGLIKEGKNPVVEVMIPLVGHSNELKIIRARLEKVAKQVMEEKKTDVKYLFGTMIEIPRACMTAEEIAKHAEFFSFGTNDLTQATFGYSRDDAESKFLQAYLHDGILEANPFEVLDRKGVGSLMRIAVEAGRWERPDLKVGICGETGGEPSSIEFCHQIGLDYVSCSPFRVPIARLAAARAALRERGGRGSSTV